MTKGVYSVIIPYFLLDMLVLLFTRRPVGGGVHQPITTRHILTGVSRTPPPPRSSRVFWVGRESRWGRCDGREHYGLGRGGGGPWRGNTLNAPVMLTWYLLYHLPLSFATLIRCYLWTIKRCAYVFHCRADYRSLMVRTLEMLLHEGMDGN